MAVTWINGSAAWAAGSSTSAPAPPTHAAGDMLVAFVTAKPTATGTPPVFSMVSPWEVVPGAAGSSGDGVAQAADVGQIWHAAFYTVAVAAGTATPTITCTNGNTNLSTIHVFRCTDGAWVQPLGVTGADTTDGTAQSIATGAMSIGVGDFIFFGSGTPGQLTRSAQAIAATGMTFGTYSEDVGEGDSATGNDISSAAYHAEITAGTPASVAITHTATLSIATANQTHGTGCAIRLRQGTAANLVPTNSTSFETSTSGWVARSSTCTIARTTAQANHGTASLEVTSLALSTTDSQVTPNTACAVTPGLLYTYRADVRAATTTRNAAVYIEWLSITPSVISTSSGTGSTDSNSAWGARTVTGVAPLLATHARILIRSSTVTAVNGEIHYGDAQSLHLGTSVAYIPGETLPTSAPPPFRSRNRGLAMRGQR